MKTALALGTFDGVHIGHRAVLTLPSDFFKVAVVFTLPPKVVINGNTQTLMTFKHKCKVLKKAGIDAVFPLDFNEVKDMSAEDFLSFLKDKFNPNLISCGFNYKFGKNALGDKELLNSFCKENKIIFNCVQPVLTHNQSVSSTLIREMLKKGEVDKANKLLFENFSFSAEVLKGDMRGRTIGFPTINQKYPDELARLKYGVYKTRVVISGKIYDAVSNLGERPTFGSDFVRCETYIKNYSGNLYGKEIRVIFDSFIREEIKFNSLNELKEQIQKDVNS